MSEYLVDKYLRASDNLLQQMVKHYPERLSDSFLDTYRTLAVKSTIAETEEAITHAQKLYSTVAQCYYNNEPKYDCSTRLARQLDDIELFSEE